MKRIFLLILVAACLGPGVSRAQKTQESIDAPSEVLQLLEHSVGSWYAKVGRMSCVCNVNHRANGRCVVVDGRRFADAIAFESLLGWFAPSRQIIGLIVFENGESLLIRATIRNESDQIVAEGTAIGALSGKTIKAAYKATCSADGWSIEVTTDEGQIIKGHMKRTSSR